ncbi:hypothetical protein RI367_001817 [Sorochytrium milnesiophthora]
MSSKQRVRVAVVGSGVAGLSAAWLLASQQSERFDVTLFEKGDYLGGHTHTVDLPPLPTFQDTLVGTVPVDTGFIVCNPVTYPNLLALLEHVGVPLTKSSMSFSVSRNRGQFEWAGDTLRTLFAQTKNLYDVSGDGVWRMLWDVLRFHWHAGAIAAKADEATFGGGTTGSNKKSQEAQRAYNAYAGMSIGAFLRRGNYSRSFIENFLVPQTAAIWSTPAGTCIDDFPVLSLIRFFRNHRMLQLIGRPRWLTLPLGARTYVERLAKDLPDVRLSCGITSVKRARQPTKKSGGVQLVDEHGTTHTFDYVIFATHGDQTLRILGDDATADERQALRHVQYCKNRAVLHRDPRLMPKLRSAWAAWNYLTLMHEADHPLTPPTSASDRRQIQGQPVCLTYWMNRLQPFIPRETHGDVFVTINPLWEPAPELVIDEWEYDHPVYSFELVEAQQRLNNITGGHSPVNTAFAGAWWGYGFHEDGVTSGLLAAMSLGVAPPFPVVLNGGYLTPRRPYEPARGLPLLPSDKVYKQRVQETVALASGKRSSISKHTTELGIADVAVAVATRIASRILGSCSSYFSSEQITRVSSHPHAAPVPLLDAADIRGLTTAVQIAEWAERFGVVVLFVAWVAPLLALLWLLGYVDVEWYSTSDTTSTHRPPTGSQAKELVWVNENIRIVWRSLK